MRFEVFKQSRMLLIKGKHNHPDAEYASNLEEVGTIEAASPEAAIAAAKTLKEFRWGKGLGKFPIVQEIPAQLQ